MQSETQSQLEDSAAIPRVTLLRELCGEEWNRSSNLTPLLSEGLLFLIHHGFASHLHSSLGVNSSLLKQSPNQERTRSIQEKIFAYVEQELKLPSLEPNPEDTPLKRNNAKSGETAEIQSHVSWEETRCSQQAIKHVFEQLLRRKIKAFEDELTELTRFHIVDRNELVELAGIAPQAEGPVTVAGPTESILVRIKSSGNSCSTLPGRAVLGTTSSRSGLIRSVSGINTKSTSVFKRSEGTQREQKKEERPWVILEFLRRHLKASKPRNVMWQEWMVRSVTPQELKHLCALAMFLNPPSSAKSSRAQQLLLKLEKSVSDKILTAFAETRAQIIQLRILSFKEHHYLTAKAALAGDRRTRRREELALRLQLLQQSAVTFKAQLKSDTLQLRFNRPVFKWVLHFIKCLQVAVANRFPSKSTGYRLYKPEMMSKFNKLKSKSFFKKPKGGRELVTRQWTRSEGQSKSIHSEARMSIGVKLQSGEMVSKGSEMTESRLLSQRGFKPVSILWNEDGKALKEYSAVPKVGEIVSLRTLAQVIKLQSWWRMKKCRNIFLSHLQQTREEEDKSFRWKLLSLPRVFRFSAQRQRQQPRRTATKKFTCLNGAKMSQGELKAKYRWRETAEMRMLFVRNQHQRLRRSGVVLRKEDINAEKEGIPSIMWWTVHHGHKEIAQLLLEGGGDPNSQDSSARTCLHEAFRLNSLPLIFLLLDFGGDLNRVDSLGTTPLYYAPRLTLTQLGLQEGALRSQKEEFDNNRLYFRPPPSLNPYDDHLESFR